jgi:hypothetical protein
MGKSVIKRWGDGEAPTIGGNFEQRDVRNGVCDVVNVVVVAVEMMGLPSGKLSHNYGKSPILIGKSTLSLSIYKWSFSIAMLNYQRVPDVFLEKSPRAARLQEEERQLMRFTRFLDCPAADRRFGQSSAGIKLNHQMVR